MEALNQIVNLQQAPEDDAGAMTVTLTLPRSLEVRVYFLDGSFYHVDLDTTQVIRRSTFFLHHAAEKIIKAPTCNFRALKLYKRYVETGVATPWPPEYEVSDVFRDLVQGYQLATRLDDCKTANTIIDAIINHSIQTGQILSPSHIREVGGEDRTPTDKLWQLAVDMYAFAAKYEMFQTRDAYDKLPQDLLVDVVIAVKRLEHQYPETSLREGFDYSFIGRDRERYHRYNELHPAP